MSKFGVRLPTITNVSKQVFRQNTSVTIYLHAIERFVKLFFEKYLTCQNFNINSFIYTSTSYYRSQIDLTIG